MVISTPLIPHHPTAPNPHDRQGVGGRVPHHPTSPSPTSSHFTKN
ncbi:hypothetical protein [Fischerella thermalis]|nr:hypothetical protein [Fischerella thermalis]